MFNLYRYLFGGKIENLYLCYDTKDYSASLAKAFPVRQRQGVEIVPIHKLEAPEAVWKFVRVLRSEGTWGHKWNEDLSIVAIFYSGGLLRERSLRIIVLSDSRTEQ